jgi:hypothetical protein
MKGFMAQQVPDVSVRMDEKNIYIEVGRFDLNDREAAEKRLKEIQEHQMSRMLPAPPKIVTVGAPEGKQKVEDSGKPKEQQENEKPKTPGDIKPY